MRLARFLTPALVLVLLPTLRQADRPDDDPVKQRVVECHEALARMARLGD